MMYVSSPKLHPIVCVVLITKHGVSIITLGFAIEVPMEFTKVSESDLILEGM
jgi:hypothetical protein